jgi:hypothetical protein
MEWFLDEGLWLELYPYLFHEDRVAAAAGQVGQILAGFPGGSGGFAVRSGA